MKKNLLLMLILFTTVKLYSQTYDNSFGISGKMEGTPNTGSLVTGIAQQPDGKYLTVSSVYETPNLKMAVRRYQNNGSVDMSFGTGGVNKDVLILNGGPFADSRAIQVAANGKIVATSTINVARYNSNGTIDLSFGTNGVLNDLHQINDVVILPNDDLLICGVDNDGPKGLAFVRKIKANGTIDSSFAVNGEYLHYNPNVTEESFFKAIEVDANGKIVVAGIISNNPVGSIFFDTTDAIVLRLNTNGTLDNTFNSTGYTRWSSPYFNNDARDLKILANGKIVVAGETDNISDIAAFVFRLNANGVLDNSFNANGYNLISPASTPNLLNIESVGIQSDGGIIIMGSNLLNTPFIAKCKADGTTDNAFGTGGVTNFPFGTTEYFVYYGIVDSSDKIVLGGASQFFTSMDYTYFLSRFDNGPTTPVSVYDYTTGQKLNFYPNPTTGIILLETDGQTINDATYKVYSLSGSVVKQGVISSKEVDLSVLNSGTYYLNIQSAKANFTTTVNLLK